MGRSSSIDTVHRPYDYDGVSEREIPEEDEGCGRRGSTRERHMEVRVRREDLMRGLHLVQGVVERRSPQPILAHVLIEPDEKGIALSATDMETGFRGHVDAIVKKPAPATCSARKLYEIVREVTAEEVTLRSAAEGWIEVLAGRSKFKVVSLPPGDFPELPLKEPPAKGSTMRVAAGTLREMIDRTLFAVSLDETRYNLSGVYMEADKGTLRMVATDGHRLAKIDRSLPDVKLAKGVIMPQKGLREFRKILDEADVADVGLGVGDRELRADLEGVAFFMRLVEGEFPNYGQVIPKDTTKKAIVQRDDLLAALRRTSLLASERSHGVRLGLSKGSLTLSASNPEQGEASEDIEASYSGDDVQVGFNARYLIEVLGVHPQGDTIEIGLTDEVGPGVVRGSQDPDYTYVLMPMRL
jgi:DNA polymerase-3 subunit beta